MPPPASIPPTDRSDKPRPFSGGRGFSLIELLVVISIVALLVAVLLPALSGARDAAEASVCLTRLQQVGRASHAFAGDEDGRLPPALTGDAFFSDHHRWYALLVGRGHLAGETTGTFIVSRGVASFQCPSDPTAAGFDRVGVGSGPAGASYYVNYNVMPREDNPFLDSMGRGGYRVEAFRRASQRLMLTEKDASDGGSLGGGLQFLVPSFVNPPGEIVAHHGGGASIQQLFVDGHAAAMTLDAVLEPGFVRQLDGSATDPHRVVLWGLGRGK